MARLITDHDPMHLHAITGALVLAHFILRWVLLLWTGHAWFPSEKIGTKVLGVALHLFLPLLSLQLPLPAKRNMSSPMIWPEFRLHSLIFSTRHVVACMVSLALPTSSFGILAQIILAHLTMVGASIVTEKYGDKEVRTTSGMPYPKAAGSDEVVKVKDSYAYAQMLASAMAHSGDASLAFMPLLAIQMAPLMMTLVRKGLASGEAYHFVYACSLAVPALGMAAASVRCSESAYASLYTLVSGWLGRELRLRFHLGRHATWLVAPATAWIFVGLVKALVPETIARALVVGALAFVFQRFQPPSLSCEWLLARKLAGTKLSE